MVLAAQRIGHGVDGAAAGGAEGKAGKVGGGEEVVHQGLAAVGAVGRDVLIAADDHLDGLIAEQLRIGRGLGGQGGFHRVDQRVDGAGGKHLQRQALQQLGEQHGAVGVHGGGHHAHLGAHAGAVQHGDVRYLAAGTAGGGDDHQLLGLVQRRHTGVQLVHVHGIRHGEHLGQVDDGAAADGDDAVKGQAADVLQDGLSHDVAGLAQAVLLLIYHMARQGQLSEIRCVDVFVGQDQVPLAQGKALCKFLAGAVLVQRWLEYDLFHISRIPFFGLICIPRIHCAGMEGGITPSAPTARSPHQSAARGAPPAR